MKLLQKNWKKFWIARKDRAKFEVKISKNGIIYWPDLRSHILNSIYFPRHKIHVNQCPQCKKTHCNVDPHVCFCRGYSIIPIKRIEDADKTLARLEKTQYKRIDYHKPIKMLKEEWTYEEAKKQFSEITKKENKSIVMGRVY